MNNTYKNCAHCGKVISPGHQARRVYCSQACKQAAYRGRKDTAQTVTLSSNRNKT